MSLDPLAIVRRRLHEQHLAGAPLASSAEVVSALCAIQAQEFAEAKWSIAERALGCTDADVERAFADGEILRTHVLRPTWHFVTPADIRWLLHLSAPRVHAANRYYYRKYGLDEAALAASARALARALEPGGPLTRPELAGALRRAGIEAEGPRLASILMHAELEQLICSGPRRGRQHTYMLLDERAPEGKELERDEALAELTLRFFRSRGPATIRDFSSWSGLTVADVKAGLELVGSSLARELAEDGTAWFAAPTKRPGPAGAGAYLIPMYDEMGISYKDLRVVFAQPPPRDGLLDRPVVIEGRTVGSWRRTLGRGAATVEALLFAALTDEESKALQAAADRFGRFLELPVVLTTKAAVAN